MKRPEPDKLESARDICWDLADYIEETEPDATHEIAVLREAAEYL